MTGASQPPRLHVQAAATANGTNGSNGAAPVPDLGAIPPPPPPPPPTSTNRGSAPAVSPGIAAARRRQRRPWWNPWASEPGPTEAELAAERLHASIAELRSELRLAAIRNRRIVTVCNGKGGSGKSTVTAYLASVIQDIVRSGLVVIDANHIGTVGRLLGRTHGETLSLRRLHAELSNITSFGKFVEKLPANQYGVQVVASDDPANADRWLDQEQFTRLVELVNDNTFTVMLDTSSAVLDPVTYSAAGLADVLVFVANAANRDSVQLCLDTMQSYHNRGFADKVRSSVIVVTGYQPNESLDRYRDFYAATGARLFGIPFDPFIAAGNAVDLSQLRPETFCSLLQVAHAIYSPPQTH